MSAALLLKGFEVELFTGQTDGTVVGVAEAAAASLEGFVTEPDHRNLEYTTPPDADYGHQLALLLAPRRALRAWLAGRGLTLLPGSTLSLGDSRRFERSDPANDYHGYIEASYGTRVVTASVHINFGLTAMDELFAACRLIRCEAALLLALSASSPFLDGVATGAHSQRWIQFPLTPPQVPLFLSHQHYIDWMLQELAAGSMQNVRHLWTSVRPNGDERPYGLNRLELRICDLISDPEQLLAITAFAELRLMQLLADPAAHDPLRASRLDPKALAALADSNDRAAAAASLEAELHDWRRGEAILARSWIERELTALAPLAQATGLTATLAPVFDILAQGNQAMRWLERHRSGASIASIFSAAITEMAAKENALDARLATVASRPLG